MSDPSAQLHGPGGLLATPGLGTRGRKRRKWGMRTKATQIAGNLYRGDTGRFQAGGASTPSGAKPKRGIVLSKQPNPKLTPIKALPKPKKPGGGKGGAAKKPAGAKPKAPAVAARQQQRDQEHAEDRAQRQTDRAERRAKMQQREQERLAKDMQRAAEQAKKKLEPAKAGGGGGSKKPSADDKKQQAQERVQRAETTATQVGLQAADVQALRQAAETGGANNATLAALGFIGVDGMTTDQGRRALTALERGDVRQYQAAVQDAKARMGRETAAEQRSQATEGKRQAAATERTAARQRQVDRLKRRAMAGGRLTDAQIGQLQDAGVIGAGGMWTGKAETYGGKKRANLDDSVFAGPDRSFPIVTAQDVRDAVMILGRTKHDKDAVKRGIIRRARAIGATDALPESWRAKSFTVFKDHSGAYRWIARTTTAYRDRDGEIISTKALEADAARMTATGQYGPLRYWHVGQPDPFDPAAPWGPGLDIGDCDYSIVIGRTSIESGTFKSAAIGRAFAESASDYEISPGFFHPMDEPKPDGTFDNTRRFERSTVPIKYGRASNLFTGLTVKEHRMDQQVYEQRVKTYLNDMNSKGVPPEVAAQSLAGMQQADKTATDQGIAYKSEGAPKPDAAPAPETIYYLDSQPGIISGGQWVALKAAPPMAEEVAVETQADGMAEEIVEEAAVPDEPAGGPYVGDLTPDEFFARLDEHLAPLIKMQDMVKSLSDGVGELKSMSSGTATKEAGVTAELTALKAQQLELAQKIAQIEGNQPATILPEEVAEALKSAGPTVPASPERPEITDVVNDPDRPWAGWAIQTYPKLYEVPNGNS